MRNFICFVAIFFVALTSTAQDKKGYYITNNNQRIDGYFEEDSNFNNASYIQFKPQGQDKFTKLNQDDIIELGVDNELKMVKKTVNIDISGTSDSNLSQYKDPSLQEKELFLTVLLEGDASLYYTSYNSNTRFFYEVTSKKIPLQQLINKRYVYNGKILQNNAYREQLFDALKCNNTADIKNFLNIEYNEKDIKPLFMSYNTCVNADYASYSEIKKSKTIYKYGVLAGLYNTTFNVEGLKPEVDDTNSLAFGIGGEFSAEFPKQNFGLYVRGEVEKLSQDAETNLQIDAYRSNKTSYSIDMYLYDVSVGGRYFFKINKSSKLYADLALVVTFPSEKNFELLSTTTYDYEGDIYTNNNDKTFSISTGLSLNFGAGYIFNDKFAAELRYETNRDLFNDTQNYVANPYSFKLQRFGLVLKYYIN
ncbi:outer membrane beta-barrel protein [Flavobacterium rhizosphaerae]|uniref:Outer membrane protein beta-barrel domain-containing protein n=1 Tax=Flavobacterium rhizosphaerae TaxID=3163298 RepID=A0ABW8YU31_9FLAO